MSQTSAKRGAAAATNEGSQPDQSETPAPKWGEMPPPERIAMLEARLAEWEQLPAEARGDPAKGVGRSAFDAEGPQGWQGSLTSADVFYLAARALARSAELIAIEAEAAWLRTINASARLALDLSTLHLEGAVLTDAHLEGAVLLSAHLEDANLGGAHLEDANLGYAHLEGAVLYDAYLEGAVLLSAHLGGAFLNDAHLEGVGLESAYLEGAVLIRASFDKTARLNNTVLTGVSFDQVSFDNTNLTVVDWSQVTILGDERTARKRKDDEGKPKSRVQRLADYKAAVRANRVLAVALQAQGLSEDAARFAYRAQLLQRRVLRLQRKPGAYFFSLLLAALAGYGYRPIRTVFWYVVTVLSFAVAYYLLGPAQGHVFQPDGALVFSVTSFHGRGFFPGGLDIESTVTKLAALEAVIGLFVEISFIAAFTQRFFGAR